MQLTNFLSGFLIYKFENNFKKVLTIGTLSDKILFVRRSGGMADAQASGACSRKAVWVQVPSPAWLRLSELSGSLFYCVSRTKPGAAEDFLLKCSDISRTGVCLARTQGPLQSDTSARKAGHALRRVSPARSFSSDLKQLTQTV